MKNSNETKEIYYNLSKKLLDLMLFNGYLEQEEYEKIDALNRLTFSPALSELYV